MVRRNRVEFSESNDFIENNSGLLKIIVGIAAAFAISYAAFYFNRPEQFKQLPLPDNGNVTWHVKQHPQAMRGQFKIVTSETSPEIHHLVTVSDWNTDKPVMSMFIIGGRSAETLIPIGKYRVIIEEGEKWFGVNNAFGKATRRSEGTKKVEIKPSGNGIIGSVITLKRKVDGNFPTVPSSRLAEGKESAEK